MLIISLLIHSYSSIQAEPIYASFMKKGNVNIFLYGDDTSVTHRDTYNDFLAALKQLAAQDKKVLLLLEDGRSLPWADKIRRELPKKFTIKNIGDGAALQLCYAFEDQETFSIAVRAIREAGDCPIDVIGCHLQITSRLYSWFLSKLEHEQERRWIKQEIQDSMIFENYAIDFGRGIGCIELANAFDFSEASYAWMYKTPQED
jgi:hypothetical protein